MESPPLSLRRIRALPSQLANQIAAGEVVERPASVVKELLENSLDAGADSIEVEVEQGGVGLIRVRDNGCGIHPEDLVLAVSPHATSKIASAADLERIASLGFRGEALASIGSVARLELTSRTAASEHGWGLRLAPGEALTPRPASHPTGTTVEVRDLFYTTPARRKFLRTEKTEFGYVEDVVKRIALSRPEVGLVLRHNRRIIHRTSPSQDEAGLRRRLASLCGSAFLKEALCIEYQAGGLQLRGWLGLPDAARAHTDLQHFFVNGRAIRDRLISHAVRQGYQARVPGGRHPAYVLYLQIEPARVDVNVHPTKQEVRFREGRLVHDFISRAVQSALGTGVDVPPAQAWPATAPAGHSAARTRPPARAAEPRALYAPVRARGDAAPLGLAVALLHGRYILAQSGQGPILVDRLGAQRQVREHALEGARRGEKLTARPLLVPSVVQLPAALAEALETEAALLCHLGFEFNRMGPEAVVVRTIPGLLDGADVTSLVRDTAAALAQAPADAALDSAVQVLIAHDANDPGPSLAQLNMLLRQLEASAVEGRDAQHGRAWIELTAEDLAQLWARRR